MIFWSGPEEEETVSPTPEQAAALQKSREAEAKVAHSMGERPSWGDGPMPGSTEGTASD